MKLASVLIALLMVSSIAMAGDVVLLITIPSEKVSIATERFLRLYPNVETIDDPAWVDPGDGSPVDQIPKYTTKQWVQESLYRILVRDCNRGKELLERDAKNNTVDTSLARAGA